MLSTTTSGVALLPPGDDTSSAGDHVPLADRVADMMSAPPAVVCSDQLTEQRPAFTATRG